MKKYIIIPIAVLYGTFIHLYADSISFQNGTPNDFSSGQPYIGTDDATLQTNNGSSFGGANAVSFSEIKYSALLRFDLSSFSGTVSSVENATITIAIQAAPSYIGQSFSLSAYVVDPQNAGWDEAVVSGLVRSSGNSWLNGTAFSSLDYSSTPLLTQGIEASDKTTYVVLNIPNSVVMEWINNPSANAGLVIRSDNTNALAFYSSDYASLITVHPLLSFDYTLGEPPIPEPGSAAILTGVASLILFTVRRRR